jgi:sugar O-acyltransferase (sialic acid O-acetyltransferase NeuD family)
MVQISLIMKSVIIGAGTYGEVYLAYLQEAGVNVVGFLDDDPKYENQMVRGIPVLGPISKLETLKNTDNIEVVYCPLGNNKLRVKFLTKAKELGYKTPNYIHPSVIISPNVSIGEGVYILLGTTIMPHTVIKDYVMISMGVHLAHHCVLEEGVFLSTGCNFGASIHAHKYAYCGISSTIMTGIHELGEDCLIGAGAVVIRDVSDRAVMAGVPAKVLKIKE